MKVNEAKKLVAKLIAEKGVPAAVVSGKTVSFAGFGYGSGVFVKIKLFNAYNAALAKSGKLEELKAALPKGVLLEFA
jgi:hypothetical protein